MGHLKPIVGSSDDIYGDDLNVNRARSMPDSRSEKSGNLKIIQTEIAGLELS
jgi:hypothetical protein